MTIRILVTGSREWDDWVLLGQELSRAVKELCPDDESHRVKIVHGNARGADWLAEQWAKAHDIKTEVHLYPGELGLRGGPVRNQEIVNAGADLCLAFPTAKSRGTWDCIKRANRAGIPVRIVPARGAKK